MDFQKVTLDNDPEQMEAEELRSVVGQFREAQNDNLAEFEEASETIDGLEGRVAEVADFDSELTEELVGVSPLSEEEASAFSIKRKRELLAEFSEDEDEDEDEEDDDPDADEDEDEEDEQEFSDFGTRGSTHDDEETANFAKEYLGQIQGLGF